MAEPDYYAVLGVDRQAPPEIIKAAYHAVARHYHPDANPGAPEHGRRFQEAARAYAVLGNPAQRSAYDRRRAAPLAARARPAPARGPAAGSYWAWERPHPYWIAERPARRVMGPPQQPWPNPHGARLAATAPAPYRRSHGRLYRLLAASIDLLLWLVFIVAVVALCGVVFSVVAAWG